MNNWHKEMKATRAAVVLVVVALLLISCAYYPQPKESYKFSCLENVPFREAMKILNTPRKIDDWLRRCVTEASPYNPPTPRVMYRERRGACKSCPSLAAYCLWKNGYEAYVIWVAYSGGAYGGHAVCLYKYKGKWWICADTVRLFNLSVYGGAGGGPYKTVDDAANAVALGCIGCLSTDWYVWYNPRFYPNGDGMYVRPTKDQLDEILKSEPFKR